MWRNKVVNGNYDVMQIEERRYTDPYKDYDWDNDGFPGEYVYGDGEWVDPEYSDERWKRVEDFPGYWVSNYGRLYSTYKNNFIYGTPIGKCGHIDVSLRKNGERCHAYLHTLVARAFVNNPHGGTLVRHMDNNPSNNIAWNLKWGTNYDNIHDCIDSGNFRYFTEEDIEKANAARRTPIVAVNLRNGEHIDYISQQEAARDLDVSQGSINRVLRGLSKHANGYYFYYADDPRDVDITTYRYSRKRAQIRAIDLKTGRTYIFKGQTEAAKRLGVSLSCISNILGGKTYQTKGYTFEYVEVDDYDR